MTDESRINQQLDDSWKAPSFRQSVVNKINEAIIQANVTSVRNSQEMENHVFQKSKTKDEYLGFVARLILHVREMNKSRNPPNTAQDPNQQQLPQTQGQGIMPDPINALQNLATQGTRMPSQGLQGQGQVQQQQPNLLQTLTQQRPMQPLQNLHQNTMPMPQRPLGQQNTMQLGPQMSGGNMQLGSNIQMGSSQNQQLNMGMMNIPPQVMQGGHMQNQIISAQMQGMRQSNPMMNQISSSGPAMNQMVPRMMMMNQPIPSPLQGMSNQMIPSPALIPSPNSQMIGSVRGPIPLITPSPNTPLNTPGQPMRSNEAVPSPLNLHDEQIYREKYRQLTKYIEPLKKMINRMGDGDGDRLLKLKKLLEILSNPNSRIPLETLLKCEAALENQLGTVKEHTANNPLLEAVSVNIQSPLANHTVQRTFRPCLEALFGPDIRNLPSHIHRQTPIIDDSTSTSGPSVSHLIQGEIARLDPKFKVSLDPAARFGTKTIELICWLDDKLLPCVPPIHITIPEGYPESLPECNISEHEYGTTDFLVKVQKALIARMAKLPKQYTLTHFFSTWEMSVRQACQVNQMTKPSPITVLLNI